MDVDLSRTFASHFASAETWCSQKEAALIWFQQIAWNNKFLYLQLTYPPLPFILLIPKTFSGGIVQDNAACTFVSCVRLMLALVMTVGI